MSRDFDPHAYPLLSEEDVRYICQMGAPLAMRDDLVRLSGGALQFTEKGLQYYRFACQRCEVEFVPESLTTEKALADLSYVLGARTLDLLEKAVAEDLAQGRLAPRDRDLALAITCGTPEEVLKATARNRECAQAGENIIPFSPTRARR